MANTINYATLARQVNGEIEYIYPKTEAKMVIYDTNQNLEEKIESIITDIKNSNEELLGDKVDKPLDEDGNAYNGTAGQVLESNGDGTTSWVTRPKVYVGSDEMPEGYDYKIDPDKINVEIDESLTVKGAAADAKSVGDAIDELKDSIVDIVDADKVDKPLDADGIAYDGEAGQVLESNGDGTTSWVTRPKVYIGSDEMPEGYDIKLDPDKINITIDKSLTVEDAAADAKVVGMVIDDLKNSIANIDDTDKVNKPLDSDGVSYNGEMGQVLETNGDGTTSWVTRARVYVGSDEMPEGYDVQIDPDATVIEIDRTLSVDGGIAEASATGAAIKNLKTKIANDIETHNTDAAAHIDIRAMITDARDFILLRDSVTGDEYKVTVENGELKCTSTVVKPINMTINTMPTKTSYDVGEIFNPAGMVATVHYADGTSKNVTTYTYPTVGLSAGSKSVSIVYIEAGVTLTANIPITIMVKCIGINVTTPPTRTQYVEGQVFNPTGMIIGATYTDGTVKAVTNYTYSTDALVLGANTVRITYVEDGVTFTANAIITVIAKKCTGISVTTLPTKIQYIEGQVFNPAGMVVTASYNDATTKTVTNYTYPTGALAMDTNIVTISYEENGLAFTANVPITVTSSFDPDVTLQDFTYISNGDGTYTIMGWKGTKNGVPSTEVLVPDSKNIVVNPLA